MASPADVICDVGCDHGLLSRALLERGKAGYVIASDIGEGPLAAARDNMSGLGLDGKYELVRSDGLSHLSGKKQPDTVIIAGMGGYVMGDILAGGMDIAKGCSELVLSPQSNIREFRSFLSDEGFAFLDERVVFEDGKYYVIEKVKYDTGLYKKLSDRETALGPVLLEKKTPEFIDYLRHQKQQIMSFIDDVPVERKDELDAFLEMIGGITD